MDTHLEAVSRDDLLVLKTDLAALRELFSERKAWTQGANARNAKGYAVPLSDPDAVCWCLGGGGGLIQARADHPAYGRNTDLFWQALFDSIADPRNESGGEYVSHFVHDVVGYNDAITRSFDQIQGVIDYTIRRVGDELASRP